MNHIRDVKSNLGKLMEAREELLHEAAEKLAAGSVMFENGMRDLSSSWRELETIRRRLVGFEKALAQSTPEHRPIKAGVLPCGYDQLPRNFHKDYCFQGDMEPNPTEVIVCAHY